MFVLQTNMLQFRLYMACDIEDVVDHTAVSYHCYSSFIYSVIKMTVLCRTAPTQYTYNGKFTSLFHLLYSWLVRRSLSETGCNMNCNDNLFLFRDQCVL